MLWSESTEQLYHSSKQSTKEEIGKSGNKNVRREKSHVAWNGMHKYVEHLVHAMKNSPCSLRAVYIMYLLFFTN